MNSILAKNRSIFTIRGLSHKIKVNEFQKKKDSIKKLEKGHYKSLTKDFKSYGDLVNYCNIEKISTTSIQRKNILVEMFKNQKRASPNTDINFGNLTANKMYLKNYLINVLLKI